MKIPFNRPYMSGLELEYITEAYNNHHLSGDGNFTKRCHLWLEKSIGVKKALLTHSCTAALEMAAILADIQPGDEVIMPSYTFVSTANAFVLRGGVPVFVDIRPDTLNIDENLIEGAISKKTKAIVPVHYAGVSCEMDTINQIAKNHNLVVIEDAAQGINSTYKSRRLGSLGDLSALSFHETKNLISGEGGALLINNDRFIERAEIIREKGTNRNKFFRGEVDKYTWVDIGSSYLPSEILAAFLWGQIEKADDINTGRLDVWNDYNQKLKLLEDLELIRRPVIPQECEHNAHMYYIILRDLETRTKLMAYLSSCGIKSVFHYVPLHSSPAGKKFTKVNGNMLITDDLSERLLRLPMWKNLEGVDMIVECIMTFFKLNKLSGEGQCR